ncbi:hypothetical protein [cf. Phormidesmis sp. LEGE 11477]|uniref:hypothetical protein n=1 Tax=cf. Phormidesmis sp. LEGE 11477 TaxID=1828680 RepID=UPI00187F9A36|nr:hypothetical protein [cf. Phormidesmis sp. LEGE 11477]MBE9062886.1 hypothetical protein [cf. Phormidesmis sp. LEGE 11477]
MDIEKVIPFVEKALIDHGLSLAKLDPIVLEAAWDDTTYIAVGKKYSVNVNTLKGQAAPQLWKKLRTAFALESIGKKTFRECITSIIAEERLSKSEPATRTAHSSDLLTVLGATLPSVGDFVGRSEDISRLSKLIDAYPLLSVVGPDGIGKKTLLAKLMRQGEISLQRVLWKPLHHSPTSDELEEELIETMGLEQSTGGLLAQFQSHPTLVVLDTTTQNAEKQVLFSEYLSLIRRITEETQSKVVTVSTYPLKELEDLVLRGKAISYHLRGLATSEAKTLLHSRWHEVAEELCRAVGGNPLLLKKIDGWYDYIGDVSRLGKIERLTVLSGLVGDFYDKILTGAALSSADIALLRDIAESHQGISVEDLLKRPGGALGIRKLLDMGLAYKSSNGLSMIWLDPLFGRKLLGAE